MEFCINIDFTDKQVVLGINRIIQWIVNDLRPLLKLFIREIAFNGFVWDV